MPNASRAIAAMVAFSTLGFAPADVAQSQAPRSPMLQVEVGDSIGLPLPDATIEVYVLAGGAAGREWVAVEPNELPEGVHLLRFSNPGYRSVVLSAPLHKGGRVALRIRLGAERDTTRRARTVQAEAVRSFGIVTEGRATADLTNGRRVLERSAIERAGAASIAALLRDVRNANVVVTASPDGEFDVGAVAAGAGYGCTLPVLINGDRRTVIAFPEANQRYGIDAVEAIEVIPRAAARLYGHIEDRWECGVLVLWVNRR